MELILNDEQRMLDRSVRSFMKDNTPMTRLRKLRDEKDPLGYSREIWKQMAELGWTSINFPEEDGGMGLGMAEVILITEAMGACLAPEPFISTVVLAGQILSLGGTKELRAEWLQPIIAGEKVVAVAYQEKGGRFDLHQVKTRATKTAGGYRLSGEKTQVLNGYGADALIVSARTSDGQDGRDGLTLFMVPKDAKGLASTRQWRVDSRNASLVRLENVEVPEANIIGPPDRGGELLGRAIDLATVALCGEMLGGMNFAFDRMLNYMKERVQFDVLIGTFQALKHRAARMFMETELSRSVVMAAARAIDEGDRNRDLLISTAKARCSDAYVAVTNEALQILGGVGMTDEEDIGFYMKHARAAEMAFGDAAYHKDRFASLRGY